MNILKNIENGLLRICIVIYIIYVIFTFWAWKYIALYGVAFKACKITTLLKNKTLEDYFVMCKMIFTVLWNHIKVLSLPLILFFILAFIWKGFFGDNKK